MQDEDFPPHHLTLKDRCLNGDFPVDEINSLLESHFRHFDPSLERLVDWGMDCARKRGLVRAEGWMQLWKAWILETRSEFGEALEGARLSLARMEESGDRTGLFRASNLTMVCCVDLGMLDEAVRWSVRTEELAEALGRPELIKTSLINTATIHLRLSAWDEALALLDRAAQLPPGDQQTDLALQLNRAACYLELDRREETRALLGPILAASKARGLQTYLAEAMVIEGRLALRDGMIPTSLAAFRKARSIATRSKDRLALATALQGIAECHLETGDTGKASQPARKALALAQAMNDRILIAECHRDLSRVLERRNPRQALAHFRTFHDLDRENFSSRTAKALEEERTKRHQLEAESTRAMLKQISTISALGQEITSTLSIESILELVHSRILSLMPADTFGIALYRSESDELDYEFFIDDGRRLPPIHVPLDSGSSMGAWCFRNNREIFSNDMDNDWPRILNSIPQSMHGDKPWSRKSVIFVPISVRQTTLGVISVQTSTPAAYTLYHLDSLKALASYVGIALENARLFEDVQYRATYDHLTGILNRSSILQKAEEHFLRTRRYGGSLTYLMVDLDHFKSINDSFGHQTGDQAIRSVARELQSHLRDVDHLGRYGGEEFLVVLPETGREGAAILAERIRKSLGSLVMARFNGQDIHCTLSIGGYCMGPADQDWETCIQKADQALYWCKGHGRDRIRIN